MYVMPPTFNVGDTIYFPFDTYDSSGASVTISGLAVTDIEVYKNGSTTQRSSDNGYALLDTDGVDFDGTTGLHGFSIDTSDNSDSGFWTDGAQYWVNINAITVDGQTVRFTYFLTLGYLLRPTTAGRKITVDSSGLADANMVKVGPTGSGTAQTARDIGASVLLSSGTGTGQVKLASGYVAMTWADIGAPTTVVNLSGTTVKTATDVVTEIVNVLNDTDSIISELAKVPKSDSNVTWNATAAAQIQTEANDALIAYGASTYAGTDTSGTTTLLTRLSAARAGYLDNANVGGLLASSSEVTAIQNNTRVVRVVPDVIERPDSGTTTYRVELFLYDDVGSMEAPDAPPTIALVNQAGTDRSSRLDSTTMALVETGRYRAIYTADAADTVEQLVWTFSVVEGGATRKYGNQSIIVDTTAVDFTSSDRTMLTAIHTKLPSNNIADQTLLTVSIGSPMQAGSTVVLTDGSLTTAKLGTFVLAKTTNITGFNDLSSAQVNAEADAALLDVGVTLTVTGRIDAAVTSRMATYAQPSGFLGATFPGAVGTSTFDPTTTGVALTTVAGNALVAAVGAQVTGDHGAGSYVRNTEPDNAGIAAIQAKTALITADLATWAARALTMLEADGDAYRYTEDALAMAPSGGGSGGTDVTVVGYADGLSPAEQVLADPDNRLSVAADGSVEATFVASALDAIAVATGISTRYTDTDGNALTSINLRQAIGLILAVMAGDRAGVGSRTTTATIPGTGISVAAERDSRSTITATVVAQP